MGKRDRIIIVLSGLLVHVVGSVVCAETIVRWNFSRGLQGWTGNQFVEHLTFSRDGLSFRSTGVDPWIEGPAVNLPADRITKVTVRMRSDADGSGELFHGPSFRAGHSVRFTVQSDDQWHEYELLITESLGAGTRFRLDPATTAGVKGGAKVQRLAGRRKTVTLPGIFCEDTWFFTTADVVKANGSSAERKGSVHGHGAMA